MKRFPKNFISIILIICMCIGVCGCMNNNENITSNNFETSTLLIDDIKNNLLYFLEKKYSDEFEILAEEKPNALQDYYTFVCCETKSKKEFKAFYYSDKTIEDGYFGILLEKLVDDYIISEAKVSNDTNKYYVKSVDTIFPSEFTNGTTLIDVLDSDFNPEVVVYWFATKDYEFSVLKKSLKDIGLTGKIHFYHLDNSVFGTISSCTYEDILLDISASNIKVLSEYKIIIE